MTAVVVVNIVLSAFVIVGVLSPLAWGILADDRDRTERPPARRVSARAARRSRVRLGRALRTGA